jgi:beta-1,4-mannooligosaccharide/beta-1,4-mannosyl-N-acetylglucosamine phosphorylase
MAKSSRKQTIVGSALPTIPWEDKPEGCKEVIWRYSRNPIIPRDAIPRANSIFNSAVVPYKGQFAGVFRCDDKTRMCNLHVGTSKDALSWKIDPDPIKFANTIKDLPFEYGYDPRVVWVEDRFYVTWCNGMHGDPTIGMAYTYDFKTFQQMENALLPCNRNGVLFPRKINGRFAMLSRPSDKGHTPFGDIFYSESPDLTYWGRHRFVMGRKGGWQSTKIGPGPVPIETSEGWLMLYHGVLTSCNGFVYSAGAALLDLEEPWHVRYRTAPYILNPRELYECVGDTPNVAFPVAVLTDAPTGRLAIYYGAADTVTALAFAQVDELIDFVKSNSAL